MFSLVLLFYFLSISVYLVLIFILVCCFGLVLLILLGGSPALMVSDKSLCVCGGGGVGGVFCICNVIGQQCASSFVFSLSF